LWAAPHLERIGALMGGPIAERAELTNSKPPRLEKYDRWGRDVSQVAMPPTFEASRRVEDVRRNVRSRPTNGEGRSLRTGLTLLSIVAGAGFEPATFGL
jgi:hypothetical protein